MGLPLRVSVLQKADRVVFVPVCFLLTRLRKLLPELPPDQPPAPKRIVIVKLAEQGSTVLANNAIRRAVEMVGRENVYFAAFEENRFIVDVLDLIPRGNVLTVPTTSVAAMFFGTIRMLLRMRWLRIDAAVDLEFLARFSAAIAYLSGARIRVGMHCYFEEGPYRGDLMTHRVLFNPQLHTSEMFQIMIEALGFAPKDFPAFNLKLKIVAAEEPVFSPGPREMEEVEQIVLSLAGSAQVPPLILLNPNASDFLPLRRWPLESYSELAKGLLARFPEVHIAFTGLASEAGPSAELVKQIDSARCFSMAGRTTLRQLLVLYNLARVLVTNDSGPAHFATLTPIQVVSAFWSGKSQAICRTFPTDACGLCGHRVQSVHQRAQQPAVCLPQQSLHANHRRSRSACGSLRSLSKVIRTLFGARYSRLRVNSVKKDAASDQSCSCQTAAGPDAYAAL